MASANDNAPAYLINGATMNEIVKAKRGQVQQYSPEKGLKKISNAESGEKKWRRAKNPEKLFEAIKIKILAQADYVLWRDAAMAVVVKMRGGDATNPRGKGPGRGKKQAAVVRVVLPDGDPGQDVADRWRKSFCFKGKTGTIIDKDKINLALDDAQHRCARIVEQQKITTVRGTEGTGEFERYTPAQYIEAARTVMGAIDLDPASSKQAQEIVKAEKFFTEQTDGRKQEWHGRVWLNPPYHRDLAPEFINRLVQEFEAGRVTQAIVLTNNSTDTDWFLVAVRACTSLCFTKGRINFYVPSGPDVLPTQGQAFFYFGSDPQRFEDVFCTIGFCLRPSRAYVGDRDGG